MDFNNDDWEDASNLPVSEDMNGRMVQFIREQTAVWQFQREGEDGDTEEFAAPVLILDITLRNGDVHQIICQPTAATAFNGILADHWGRMWGMLSSTEVELSDEALDRLIHDTLNPNQEGNTDGSD